MKRKFVTKGLACLSMIFIASAMLTAEPQKPTLGETRQGIFKHLMQKSGRPPAGKAVPKSPAWAWCSQQYETVPKQNPKVLYGLIADHLPIAETRYLRGKSSEERRHGLGMVSEAAQCASHLIKDHWLATSICEAYMLPHFDDADERHWKYLSKQNILEVIIDLYAEAANATKTIELFKSLIEIAHNRNTADGARLRLAQLLDKQGEYKEAVRYLKEIDDKEGVGGAKALIPVIEKKIKNK
jgi:hypothetical protein